MSTLKVNKIRDTSGSADAITLDPSGGAVLAGVTTISTARVTTGITSTSLQVGAAVTITSDGIEASGIGITCANINGGQIGGRRNIVINGGMSISQRYGTTATTPTHEAHVIDRWESHLSQTGKFNVQQVEDSPSGEGVGKYSSKITSLSAYTVTANDYFVYNQNIEGSNVDHLQFGTSSAKTITVSFYVKSSLTGTFAMAISNQAYNRRQAQEYTINSANTWERKSLTFAGDTSGTWLTTNGVGMRVHWSLGGGSTFFSASPGTWLPTNDFHTSNAVNVVSTNAATWYITGVQVEVGTQATPFEYRSFGEELKLCQRYFQKYISPRLRGVIGSSGTAINRMGMTLITEMRANPSATWSGNQDIYDGGGTASITGISAPYVDHVSFEMDATISGSLGNGSGACVCSYLDGNEATLSLDAEI